MNRVDFNNPPQGGPMHQLLVTALSLTVLTLLANPAAAANAEKGQGIYMNFCAPCHAAGVAGAPKVGDKSAWAPRIKQGEKLLVEHSIKGYQGASGFMPARGGNSALSDADVADAVAYMVSQSQ
jgi:cytochrome c5